MSEVVKDMEAADSKGDGDTKRVFNLVNVLVNKPKKPPTNLNSDVSGNLLRSPEDTAAAWELFLSDKFSATDEELLRPSMPPLPKVFDPITKDEFVEKAIKSLKVGKAPGPDGGVPAIVYKNCPLIKNELFQLLQFMWEEEVVPVTLVRVKFRMIYKHKGFSFSNDPSKYRCIALLNHAYKVLSYIILGRLLTTTDDLLQDWQAGFRASRGCRDNAMIFRVLC